jgi:flagellar biosynthesis/type III secretory pathway chaperone
MVLMTDFVKPTADIPDEDLTREQMIFRLDLQRGVIERLRRMIGVKCTLVDQLEGLVKDNRQGRALANIRADRAEAALREHRAQDLLKNARF